MAHADAPRGGKSNSKNPLRTLQQIPGTSWLPLRQLLPARRSTWQHGIQYTRDGTLVENRHVSARSAAPRSASAAIRELQLCKPT